jgi:hypothetical protein
VAINSTVVVSPQVLAYPQNATSRGLPITALQFWRVPFPPYPRCVVVTGGWGYCSTLKPDVYQAVLRRGAQMLFSELMLTNSAGLAEWREGDVLEKYDLKQFEAAIEKWQGIYDKAVKHYRRVCI